MDYKTLFSDINVANEVLFAEDEEKAFIRYLEWLEGTIQGNLIENKQIKSENESLKIKLKHARSSFDFQMKRRMEAEDIVKQFEDQFFMIKDILCTDKHMSRLNEEEKGRLAFLHSRKTRERNSGMSPDSSVMLSPSDVSIDPVDGDTDTSFLRNGKKWKRRRTASVEGVIDEEDEIIIEASPKRRKTQDHILEVTAKARVTVNPREEKKAKSSSPVESKRTTRKKTKSPEVEIKSPVKKPTKDATVHTTTPINPPKMTFNGQENIPPSAENIRQLSASPQKPKSPTLYPVLSELQQKMSTVSQPNQPSSPTPSSQRTPVASPAAPKTAAFTGHKPHVFVSKTVIKPETCSSCNKKVKFGKQVMKCRDCKTSMHPECSEKSSSCVPMLVTPKKSKDSKNEGAIASYCPNVIPRVPPFITYCVQEIEKRGLHEVGLYRIPGSDKHIKELKEKMLKCKGNPHLEKVDDINVVCGALKDFLRGLKEPLLTYQLHTPFTAAAEIDSEEGLAAILEAIAHLPPANKDTLAFLMMHLQKVAARCEENKMPIPSLAKVFGPTIVGHSSPNPDPATIWKETNLQPKVVERMLNISPDYWKQYMLTSDNPHQLSPGSPVGSYTSSPPRSPATPEFKPGVVLCLCILYRSIKYFVCTVLSIKWFS